ncbi:hypothetical protein [Nocardia arthritidis]|uniref:Uncharacterized protein n=1 Tax=Nocardia arthritidis TaxID=228602 RepID=A0A6G9YAV6_9NOCA|nr:hypothetical protein [Nocardia arthritidis]QIS10217.1 hypothetical protein F5544_11625 [Nocardia arthritidis]
MLRDHVAAPVRAVLESTRGRSVRRFDRDARAVDSRFAERLSSGWVVRQTDSIVAQSIRRVGSSGLSRAKFISGMDADAVDTSHAMDPQVSDSRGVRRGAFGDESAAAGAQADRRFGGSLEGWRAEFVTGAPLAGSSSFGDVLEDSVAAAAQAGRRFGGSPEGWRAEFVTGAPLAGSSSSGDVLEDSAGAVARGLLNGGRGNGYFDAPGGGVAGGFGRDISGDETDSAAV